MVLLRRERPARNFWRIIVNKRALFGGYAMVVASAVIYGCMPLMANFIYDDGVNALTLVLLRNLLSLPVILSMALLARQNLFVGFKNMGLAMFVGMFGCAITPLLLFSSYTYISGGTATVFHFVYPAVVLLAEMLIMRSGAKWSSIAAVLVCVLGIALFYDPSEGINLVGGALALSSGVTYAVYIVLLGKFGTRGMGTYVFCFFAELASTIIILIACFASGEFSFPQTTGGWILSFVFAAAVNGGAVVLFQRGTVLIGGQRASVLSTFEPLTSIVVGYFAFGEDIGWRTVVGSVLVLGAAVMIALIGSSHENKEEKTV